MKSSKTALSIMYFGLAVILLFGSLSPATATINATYNENTDEIQNLLDQYFQLRYESRKNNVIPDLSQFVAVNSEKARNFLSTETEKLRLERLHASKNDWSILATNSRSRSKALISIPKLPLQRSLSLKTMR